MIGDIWQSLRALPLWVQVWVFATLVPVNAASLCFVSEPMGGWIAVLAIGAILPNLPILLVQRGFSKTMALPHLLPWTVLVALLIFARPEASGGYALFLWLLLVVDLVSLCFDYPDALAWWRGDRTPAGRMTQETRE